MQMLYLHAGMMKTGTTSIQVALAANPIGKNYRYIGLQANNSSTAMRMAFAGGVVEPGKPVFAEPGFRERFLGHLAEQLQHEAPIGIVSAELISATFSLAHYQALHDWLAARVPEVKVVLYIREPASFMESLYQQKLQEGGHASIRPNALYPKYRRRLEPLEAVFGRENVVYRSFSPSRFTQGDIVLDFAQLIGLDFHEHELRRVNASLSRPAAALLHLYHQHTPEGRSRRLQGNEAKRRLVRLLHQLQGPKLRLAPELLHKTLQRQQDDIAWMASRLDAPLPAWRAPAEGECIRGEADLERLDDMALDWLGEMAGGSYRQAERPAIAAALASLSMPQGFQARLSRARRLFA